MRKSGMLFCMPKNAFFHCAPPPQKEKEKEKSMLSQGLMMRGVRMYAMCTLSSFPPTHTIGSCVF